MNMNTVFIRAAIATAFVGLSFTAVRMPKAAAQDVVSMSVDARAPLQATLLPMINVVTSASNPDALGTTRIANDGPLSVTLMPTVSVNARAPALASTPPSVNTARIVAVDSAVSGLPRVDVERVDATPALHARVLPR